MAPVFTENQNRILSILHLATAYSAGILTHEKLYYWLIIPAIVEDILFFIPSVLWLKNTKSIRTFLHMIQNEITQSAPDDDVRCALFRPSIFKKRLFEVLRITEDGIANRSAYMTITQGVAGMAYRNKRTCYVPIAREWQEQLMTDLGFTDKDLVRFQSDRKSYVGIPVRRGGNQVIAILSLDSNSSNTFTPDMIERVESIARYLTEAIS